MTLLREVLTGPNITERARPAEWFSRSWPPGWKTGAGAELRGETDGRRVLKRRTLGVGTLSLVALLVLSGLASEGAEGHVVTSGERPAGGAFAVALAAPRGGDVSYGVAQVRIASGSRALKAPSAVGTTVFAQRVGGLAVVARSPQWHALRKTTRVYVVVSSVAGAGARVRDVALFVVRRRTGARSDGSTGAIFFSIANARPVTGSFWVRGVDRRGFAKIFAVRDILTTAVGNWSRYVAVLKAAHALAAALRLVTSPTAVVRPRATASAARARSLWTGGQRRTERTRAIFRLIARTIADPPAFAAAKHSPLVLDFIAHELNNVALARRWRAVTAELPLQVPDTYAAAAQEEARFTRVKAPKISRSRVQFEANQKNSSDQLAHDWVPRLPNVEVSGCELFNQPDGSITCGPDSTKGVITSNPPGIDCPLPSYEGDAVFCSGLFFGMVTLTATPAPGSAFYGWEACDDSRSAAGTHCAPTASFPGLAGCDTFTLQAGYEVDYPGSSSCTVDVSGQHLIFAADFTGPRPTTLTVDTAGSGTGKVTSSLGVDCPATCSAIFGYGHYVTLTARPDPGSTFFGWAGCDLATGVNCTMTMFSSRSVTAVFAKSAVFARIDRVAGDGHPCMVPPGCGDGPSATFAELNNPSGVALDSRGDLYIADSGDKEVREVTPGGAISRIAGTGVSCAAGLNATGCGDGGRATAATFDRPAGVAVDSHGDVYVADYRDSAIRKFAPGGTISTVAGNGLACFGNLPGCGDGGPAKGPTLVEPEGVAVDSGGNLFIADASQNAIREVSQAGIITTLAGLGSNNWCTTAPNCGDGGPAADAKLQTPHGVAVDSSGDVYVADTGDNEIRKITPDKRISLVFGNGFVCTSGTCTSGRADAVLHGPQAVAVDAAGDVYIADTNANQVLELTPDGTINRIAGAGGSCDPPDCGDGNAAFSAQLAGPKGLALDPTGALYIADAFHNEVRVVR